MKELPSILICILLLVIFLDALGMVAFFTVFKGKIPEYPREDDPTPACPGASLACPLCGGDPEVCAEISLGSLSKQANKKETNPIAPEAKPKEGSRQAVQLDLFSKTLCHPEANL